MPIIIGYFIGKFIAEAFIGVIKLIVGIISLIIRLIIVPCCTILKDIYQKYCDIFDSHFEYRNTADEHINSTNRY